MKMTIEPTQDQSMYSPECTHPTVVVELPHDDLDIYDMVEMFKGMLHSMGFHHKTVDRLTVEDKE